MDNSDIYYNLYIQIVTICTFGHCGHMRVRVYIDNTDKYMDNSDITGIYDIFCQILNKNQTIFSFVFMNPIICVYLVIYVSKIPLEGSIWACSQCIYMLGYIW